MAVLAAASPAAAAAVAAAAAAAAAAVDDVIRKINFNICSKISIERRTRNVFGCCDFPSGCCDFPNFSKQNLEFCSWIYESNIRLTQLSTIA